MSDPWPYMLGEAVTAPSHASPYQRGRADPDSRTLSVFTQDPATSRFDAAVARIAVPYEPLAPGPSGRLFVVHDYDDARGLLYPPLELDDLALALRGGLEPSTTDPRYAQQMVYALAVSTYDRFARALGRHPGFGFTAQPFEDSPRLRLRPHAFELENAWYDPDAREVAYGYFRAGPQSRWKTQPGDLVHSALSHDIVVHELSHALLDGMRSNFLLPTNLDVSALHEGFADLIAIFQRFRHRELVRHALGREKCALTSRLLTDLARQFGQTGESGDGRTALRTAILDVGGVEDDVASKFRYEKNIEEHNRGAVLVTAVFEAFRRVFERKTAKLRRVAAGGQESDAFLDLVTDEACSLASQFLNIVIRAIDYCPPVDVTFGEYLRAMITADADLVPDDEWGYRESLVLAFRRFGITVPNVPDLSEDALKWQPPEGEVVTIGRLAFANLRHAAHPAADPGTVEREACARAVGEVVTVPIRAKAFGLRAIPRAKRDIGLPVIQSVRSLRRVAPGGDLHFNTIVEVTQRRRVLLYDGHRYTFDGGATLVIDADGTVSYSIAKWIDSTSRLARYEKYVKGLDRETKDILRAEGSSRSALWRRLHACR